MSGDKRFFFVESLQVSGKKRNFATCYELEVYFEMGSDLYRRVDCVQFDEVVLDVVGHPDTVGSGRRLCNRLLGKTA